MKKVILFLAGGCSFSLGILGAFLPLLPTTPLLLLSVFCFSKSSKKISKKIQQTKIYKKHLENFILGDGIPLKQKLLIQILANTMMIVTMVSFNSIYVYAILGIGIIIHNYVFIFKIKTL